MDNYKSCTNNRPVYSILTIQDKETTQLNKNLNNLYNEFHSAIKQNY